MKVTFDTDEMLEEFKKDQGALLETFTGMMGLIASMAEGLEEARRETQPAAEAEPAPPGKEDRKNGKDGKNRRFITVPSNTGPSVTVAPATKAETDKVLEEWATEKKGAKSGTIRERVMAAARAAAGPWTMDEMASAAGVKRQQVNATLQWMTAKELVGRINSEGRSRKYYLTEKGPGGSARRWRRWRLARGRGGRGGGRNRRRGAR
nr:hypothetical protein [uncultured Rhodopila sp.]